MDPHSRPLCITCTSVPIRTYFQPNYPDPTPATREPHKFDEPAPHNLLTEILSKSAECSLCRLIGHAIHAAVKQQHRLPCPALEDLDTLSIADLFDVPTSTKLRCYIHPEPINLLEAEIAFISDKAFRLIITIRLDEGNAIVPLPPEITTIRGMIQLIGSSAKSLNTTPQYLGRDVGSTLDVNLLRRWFDICHVYHDHAASVTNHRKSPLAINLIDVHEQRIFSASPMDGYIEYAALSYTWGGDQKFKLLRSNFERWRAPDGMPDFQQLPKTIKHAIQLAQELGQRYLWVDALCIVQDDDAARDFQLQQMDRIYALAQYTIVAAAGSNADAGLPGLVPQSRRILQMVEKVQGVELAVPFPTLIDAVASTTWATRGWTYQEQLLSGTMIIFTPHQVYFQCDRKVFQEDVQIELDGRLRNITWSYLGIEVSVPMERLHTFRTLSLFTHDGSPTGVFERYKNIVEVYTRRDFGSPGDILAGFMGITMALQGAPGSMGYVAGLSVAGFEDALLWVPRGPHTRRRFRGTRVFPSWAWAGWVGACQIEWVSDPSSPCVEEWFAVGPGSERARLPLVSYDATRFRERPTSGPFAAGGVGGWGLSQTHTLEFRGRVGHFCISGRRHSERGFPVLSRRLASGSETGYLATVCIVDDEERWVGTVMMTESEASAITAPVPRMFLLVSRRGAPVGCYADDTLYSKEWRHGMNVLMVERALGGQMERLAVGIIHKDAWESARTSEEYVRLI